MAFTRLNERWVRELFACDICGAVVEDDDQEKHVLWHKALDAQRDAGRNEPPAKPKPAADPGFARFGPYPPGKREP